MVSHPIVYNNLDAHPLTEREDTPSFPPAVEVVAMAPVGGVSVVAGDALFYVDLARLGHTCDHRKLVPVCRMPGKEVVVSSAIMIPDSIHAGNRPDPGEPAADKR